MLAEPVAYRPIRTSHGRLISARHAQHHVHVWGDPSLTRPERPPLVLVHGYMDVGASFQFVVDALAALEGEARYVLAPDLRGFGRSSNPPVDAYWFPDYLGDLDAVLDALVPGQPVDLLGHSMGGNVVMLYAGVRPERVRRLINLEGFGLPESRPEQAPSRLRQWLDQLKQPQSIKAFPSLAAVAERLQRNNPRLSADKAAWLSAHWAEEREGGFHVQGDPAHKRVNPQLYRKAEALACWSRIEAPLLWVEGAETQLEQWWGNTYTKAEFHERLRVVRNVEPHVLEGAGHMLHHDRPEALAALILPFLERPA